MATMKMIAARPADEHWRQFSVANATGSGGGRRTSTGRAFFPVARLAHLRAIGWRRYLTCLASVPRKRLATSAIRPRVALRRTSTFFSIVV